MNLKTLINTLSEKYFDEAIHLRRKIHSMPELSFQEHKTSELIKSFLTKNNIPFTDNWAKTGVLAVIDTMKNGKTIALRADMDALPITEETNLEFASKNKGVMHACGHDMHTASLLITAKILNQIKKHLSGKILLVFQPGEEKLPGGAKQIMSQGIFNKHKPDLIIGQHILPDMPVGKAGFKSGMYMASTDEIYITVNGKGGHAAMPHKINDTVLAASQIIVNLQQIVSRKAPPNTPSVLSIGKLIAPGATNIIPSTVEMEGTFRTMNEKWRQKAHSLIKQISETTAKTYGTSANVNIVSGYPFLKNDIAICNSAQKYASEYLSPENI